MTAQEPEDGILDLLAAVAAARDGRRADLDLVLRHGSAPDMLDAAVRLLAVVAGRTGAPAEEFRQWGMNAWSQGAIPGS